jgi:hypothetical protein
MLRKYCVSFFIVFLFFYFVSAANAGFGISPYQISNPYLLRGSVFASDFLLSRSVSAEDNGARIVMVVENESMRPWIVSDRGSEFFIPAGTQRFPVKITVTVPENANFGDYKTKVYFNTMPGIADDRNGSGLQTLLGVAGVLDFKVIDKDVRRFSVDAMSLRKVEDSEDTVLTMRVRNAGNTAACPTKVSFVIRDLLETKEVAKFEITGVDCGGSAAPPFADKRIDQSVTHELTSGYYWAEIRVFDGNNLVGETVASLEILPSGVLGKLAALAGRDPEWKILASAIAGILGGGATLVGLMIFRLVKRMN